MKALVTQEVSEVVINEQLMAPEVCSLVEYGKDSWGKEPGKYRITGYLCEVELPEEPWLREILDEEEQELRQRGEKVPKRLRWCYRHEATHLALTGIAGLVVPVGTVKVTGHLRDFWSPNMVEHLQAQADRRAREMVRLF